MELGKIDVRTFSDGEIFVEVGENIRDKDVFVVQSLCRPVNHHLMELLVMIDAMKRASGARVNVVIPYYGYARQDRKVAPRVPISAKVVANLISVAGADRVVCLDLHANQIQGFFQIPVDNLFAAPVVMQHIKRSHQEDNLVIVSPDAGGVERARAFAKRLNVPLAVIAKRKDSQGNLREMNLVGDVSGRRTMIMDDMVDTGTTLVGAARSLIAGGAESVSACCVHPVLSAGSVPAIEDSKLESLLVSDSIPLEAEAEGCPMIKTFSVAGLLGEAIRRIHRGESVSSLFI
jgi:ribose-phosphate pyrophosphokinase